jgi:mannose-1-phosphate guanylyltransferase
VNKVPLCEKCYKVNKGTATCIGLAAAKLMKKDNDAIMMVFPSDHYVEDEKAFVDILKQAVNTVNKKRGLITIGITPTRPETGYGYIQMGEKVINIEGTYKVERFVEKPNVEVAKDFLLAGNYLWNSGMFVWRADALLTIV